MTYVKAMGQPLATETPSEWVEQETEAEGKPLTVESMTIQLRDAVHAFCDAFASDDACSGFRALLRPSEPIDPMDRIVDGLSVRRCLERYTAWQRESKDGDWREGEIWSGPRPSLTAAQKAAARLAWSSELKRKQDEARAKERVDVVVDDDRWEE